VSRHRQRELLVSLFRRRLGQNGSNRLQYPSGNRALSTLSYPRKAHRHSGLSTYNRRLISGRPSRKASRNWT